MQSVRYCDRFIPSRKDIEIMKGQLAFDAIEKKDLSDCFDSAVVRQEAYRDQIFQVLFDKNRPAKVLKYKEKIEPLDSGNYEEELKKTRTISTKPFKIQKGRELSLDFYTSPIHISSTGTLALLDTSTPDDLAITIQEITGALSRLSLGAVASPSCVHWSSNPKVLFTGLKNGDFCFSDVVTLKTIYRKTGTNLQEISTAAATTIPTLFYVGSRSGAVSKIDLRASKNLDTMGMHTQNVSGLALSPDGIKLASGGNENSIQIWDVRRLGTPVADFRCHKAAVRALAWAPWERDLLFSGGGMLDKTIKAISVRTKQVVATESRFQSQVAAIHTSQDKSELVATYWNPTYQSVVWKYHKKTFIPLETLDYPDDPMLYTALNEDKTTLVTAGMDGSLLYWKVFEEAKKAISSYKGPFADLPSNSIR